MFSEIIIAAIFLVNYGYVESGTNPLTIIGGTTRYIEDYPFLVSVQYNTRHCGGCIISPTLVMTAAHCVYNVHPAYVEVRIGSSCRAAGPAGLLLTGVLSPIHEHQNYNHTTKVNDISLLSLPVRLDYGATIGNITLPATEMTFRPDTVIRVIGFGQRINEQRATRYTQLLKEGNLYIEKNNACQTAYGINGLVSQICAKTQNISLTNCDDGSPVLFGDQLIGIVSRTERGGRIGGYTILVRVSDYLNFIYGIMNQNP